MSRSIIYNFENTVIHCFTMPLTKVTYEAKRSSSEDINVMLRNALHLTLFTCVLHSLLSTVYIRILVTLAYKLQQNFKPILEKHDWFTYKTHLGWPCHKSIDRDLWWRPIVFSHIYGQAKVIINYHLSWFGVLNLGRTLNFEWDASFSKRSVWHPA